MTDTTTGGCEDFQQPAAATRTSADTLRNRCEASCSEKATGARHPRASSGRHCSAPAPWADGAGIHFRVNR